MKIVVILTFVLCLISCRGDKPYPAAALKVQYPNLHTPGILKGVRTERGDLNNILDTIFLGELNESNSFSSVIEFEHNPPDYIIFIPSTLYSDTLSDISFKREEGNGHIIDYEYKFNGILRKDLVLIIE